MKAGDPAAFAALEAADKRAWQSITVEYARRAGITSANIEARLARITLEGWLFQAFSDEKFCALMELFCSQVGLM